MKHLSPKLVVILLALLWPVGQSWAAPSRFSEPATSRQDKTAPAEMESIARDTGESADNTTGKAKVDPPRGGPAASDSSKASGASAESTDPGQAAKETADMPGSDSAKAETPPPQPAITSIADDVRREEHQSGLTDDTAGQDRENVEWVGKDRRRKRVNHEATNLNQMSHKIPGKLIITDEYHHTPTELLGTADVRYYGARPEESRWQYSGSKFVCELRHEIPGFGYAVMKQGVEDPLHFAVEADGLLGGSGLARIQSRPPEWRRFTLVKDLGTVAVAPKDKVLFSVSSEWVKRLILELREGMQPTITFWDDDTGGEDVVLTLSSFNFQQHLPEFSRCLGQLLPYSFKDVRKRTVYFGYDKFSLSPGQRERLKKLIEYAKLDETVKRVDITGYSDSVGFARYNRTLAQRRANEVKKYLLAEGLPADKLVVKARGEKGKTHSNRTAAGRSKNRRVEVTLVK